MATKKYLDDNGLLYLWGKIKALVIGSVPTKTSDLTNDSGFITSADIPAGATPSSTSPKMDGTASVGTETAFARGDHRHPSDTSKANLDSPALTGTPTAPTATAGTNTTQIATTAFVSTAVSNAVGSLYKVKGTKATYANLPSSGNVTGDVWNVTAAYGDYPAGTNWVWTGTEWDALGGAIDLSGYVLSSDLSTITNTEIDTIVAS